MIGTFNRGSEYLATKFLRPLVEVMNIWQLNVRDPYSGSGTFEKNSDLLAAANLAFNFHGGIGIQRLKWRIFHDLSLTFIIFRKLSKWWGLLWNRCCLTLPRNLTASSVLRLVESITGIIPETEVQLCSSQACLIRRGSKYKVWPGSVTRMARLGWTGIQ